MDLTVDLYQEDLDIIISQVEFLARIDEIKNNNEMNYIESITYFCEQSDYDIMDVIPFIGDTLKTKLYHDACDLNLLINETPRLPL